MAVLAMMVASAPTSATMAQDGPATAGEQTGCPGVDEVWRAAQVLMGRAHRSSMAVQRPQLDIEDRGDRFRIVVAGHEREYIDAARDCGERARVAAVFVALTLAPPVPVVEPPPPPPPPPPPARPLPPAASHWVRIEPSLAMAVAPGGAAGSAPWNVGANLRLSLAGRRFGFVAGAGVSLPFALQLSSGIEATELRVPFEAAFRLFAHRGWSTVWFDAGLSATLVSLVGQDVTGGSRKNVYELGLRAAATVAFGTGHILPFLSAVVEVTPWTHDIAVMPLGVVGHTAPLWLSLNLGIAADLVKPW